jgi:hypothetical protein
VEPTKPADPVTRQRTAGSLAQDIAARAVAKSVLRLTILRMSSPEAVQLARTGAGTLWSRVLGVRSVSKRRRAMALSVAILADTLQVVLLPMFWEGAASPFDDALDLVVAATLWVLLGFSPRLALAFVLELTPGVALFPTWTALVATLPLGPQSSGALEPKPAEPV